MDFISVFRKEFKPHLVIQQRKGPGKDIEAGNDAILFAQELRFTLTVFRQNGIGRHVFTRNVFLNGLQNQWVSLQFHGYAVHHIHAPFPFHLRHGGGILPPVYLHGCG